MSGSGTLCIVRLATWDKENGTRITEKRFSCGGRRKLPLLHFRLVAVVWKAPYVSNGFVLALFLPLAGLRFAGSVRSSLTDKNEHLCVGNRCGGAKRELFCASFVST